MNNFSFHNPTHIHFGRGQIARLTQEIPQDTKVLFTYGGGSIKTNGVLAQVHVALSDHRVLEFGGIEPNPSYETLVEAVKLAKAENIDFLLAVGGGSVVDGTKFIAAAMGFEGDPWAILSEKASIDTATPFGCVLTLPATGSESNPNAVVSRKSTQEKLSFGHPLIYPVFAIMDPESTFTLPPRQTANGIVDAWVHITEQYLTCRDSSSIQDRYAEGLLITLVESGTEVMEQPDNYDARATVIWAANQALYGLVGCQPGPLWSGGLSRFTRKVFDAIGLPKEVKPLHWGIRGTVITEMLLSEGADMFAVQQLADHDSIETTMLYLDRRKVAQKKAVDIIESLKLE